MKKRREVELSTEWFSLEDGTLVAMDEYGYLRTKQRKLVHRESYEAAYAIIPPGWIVHHVDFDRWNNHPENLIALPKCFHNQIHTEMRRTRVRLTRKETYVRLCEYLEARVGTVNRAIEESRAYYRRYRDIIDEYAKLEKRIKTLAKPDPELSVGIPHVLGVEGQMMATPSLVRKPILTRSNALIPSAPPMVRKRSQGELISKKV